MKKILLFVFLLAIASPTHSQTLLSSRKLELKKPFDRQQLISFGDESDRNFYVVASDKEKTTAVKYNSALFVRDSISTKRPEGFSNVSGYSVGPEGSPYVYWASDDFSKIAATGFDFGQHIGIEKQYAISYDKETFLNAFSYNGYFYILTVFDDEQKLKIYSFTNGIPGIHVMDFSSFSFKSESGKAYKLAEFLTRFPPEKMDSSATNPLFLTAAKSKLYADKDALWLTLDHMENATQVFRISLSDYSVTEFNVPQPEVKKSTSSNSFYKNGMLYQLRASENELTLSSKALGANADNAAIVYRFAEQDTVVEKNSPFLFQHANQKPSTVKTFKKFLNRVSGCDLAISVYQVNGELLVTSGGVRRRHDTGTIILGATLGMGIAVGGGSVGVYDDVFGDAPFQQFFFESLFDKNFKHLPKEQLPLAVDFLSEFLAKNQNVALYYLSPFSDYFVLSYYDSKLREIKLRKFADGFPAEPIIK
ncbi:MAG: hypothetical protein EOO50_01355 [Flavobacterium sp.]|uniref:hypothetical protein n=1 Tax=Flavobacterium sp. TaxID=239 RepID=UPI001229209C|nr:hypothetical protein [Flavobacterium sp.]RZJ68467.1 MAG: hypothetical protein EOO50_01355 [Flavobacterium sp.]